MKTTTQVRKYPRCAKGTRRTKKSHACRSVTHTRCKNGTRRSRTNGRCYTK
jgi:hypothetical protein